MNIQLTILIIKKFDQAQKDLLIQEEDLANNSVDIFYLNNLKQLAKLNY